MSVFPRYAAPRGRPGRVARRRRVPPAPDGPSLKVRISSMGARFGQWGWGDGAAGARHAPSSPLWRISLAMLTLPRFGPKRRRNVRVVARSIRVSGPACRPTDLAGAAYEVPSSTHPLSPRGAPNPCDRLDGPARDRPRASGDLHGHLQRTRSRMKPAPDTGRRGSGPERHGGHRARRGDPRRALGLKARTPIRRPIGPGSLEPAPLPTQVEGRADHAAP